LQASSGNRHQQLVHRNFISARHKITVSTPQVNIRIDLGEYNTAWPKTIRHMPAIKIHFQEGRKPSEKNRRVVDLPSSFVPSVGLLITSSDWL
jgi:hypothetical protein